MPRVRPRPQRWGDSSSGPSSFPPKSCSQRLPWAQAPEGNPSLCPARSGLQALGHVPRGLPCPRPGHVAAAAEVPTKAGPSRATGGHALLRGQGERRGLRAACRGGCDQLLGVLRSPRLRDRAVVQGWPAAPMGSRHFSGAQRLSLSPFALHKDSQETSLSVVQVTSRHQP